MKLMWPAPLPAMALAPAAGRHDASSTWRPNSVRRRVFGAHNIYRTRIALSARRVGRTNAQGIPSTSHAAAQARSNSTAKVELRAVLIAWATEVCSN